jgi:hypothetical protein
MPSASLVNDGCAETGIYNALSLTKSRLRDLAGRLPLIGLDGFRYGKPPKENQFVKGESGNSKGRGKGGNTGSILREVLDQPVTITKDGRSRKVKFYQAFLHKMVAQAPTKILETTSCCFD